MQKFLSLVLVIAMILISMSMFACGSSDDETKEPPESPTSEPTQTSAPTSEIEPTQSPVTPEPEAEETQPPATTETESEETQPTATTKIEAEETQPTATTEIEVEPDESLATDEGLIAYYPFDGDTKDHSGNGADATNNGAEFVAGKTGQALSFNRGGDYVHAPVNINPDVMPQVTMTAWAKPSDDLPNQTLISHDDGHYDRSLGIDYQVEWNGWVAFSGDEEVLGYHPIDVGQWTFIAAVYDQTQGTVKLFVNGSIYDGTGICTQGWDYIHIGENPAFAEFFAGEIDEVKIFDYALSEEDLRSLHETGSTGTTGTSTVTTTPTSTGNDPIAYYPFDGDTKDYSGNGADATNNGAEFVAGKTGQALSFNRGGDYVHAPVNINPDVMPQVTMTAWAKPSDDLPNQTLISHDDGHYDRSLGIDYQVEWNGWVAFSGDEEVLGYHPIDVGQWTFIAAVYDQNEGTVKLFVNGSIYDGTGICTQGWDYIHIGENPAFAEFFAGEIDEVKIFDYALSEDELKSLYETGSTAVS